MTSLILVAGLVLVAACAVVATRPAWRLPVLAFAIFAIPGNVDDLLPQMVLDPHPIDSATAPAISAVDLLIGWAVILTVAERRRPERWAALLVALAVAAALAAAVVSVAAALRGVEALSVIRGIVTFARLPALLYLGTAIWPLAGQGVRLAWALVAGGAVLVGNGVYTTATGDLDRFTATTFGRNGLAVALVVIVVAATGLAFQLIGERRARGSRGWDAPLPAWLERLAGLGPVLAVAAAAVCLFAASATGTRMALLVLIGTAGVAFVASPTPYRWRAMAGAGVTVAAAAAVLGASVFLTAAGARTVSVVTDPQDTVGAVTNPGSVSTESEIRTRQQFWDLAIEMGRASPVTGVGPFQWNVQRYVLDPAGPVVVADAHHTYFQVFAEYGIPVVVSYVALLIAVVLRVAWLLRRRSARQALGWAGLGIALAALVLPTADVANSHLFNVRNGALEWLLLGAAVGLATGASRAAADDGSGRYLRDDR